MDTNNPNGRPRSEGPKAFKWLQEMLSLRDTSAAELKQIVDVHAAELGFSWRTVVREKLRHGILHYKIHDGKGSGRTLWTLKSATQIAEVRQQERTSVPLHKLSRKDRKERLRQMSFDELLNFISEDDGDGYYNELTDKEEADSALTPDERGYLEDVGDELERRNQQSAVPQAQAQAQPEVPIWKDHALWDAFPIMAKSRPDQLRETVIRLIESQPNWYKDDDMMNCWSKAQEALTKAKRAV